MKKGKQKMRFLKVFSENSKGTLTLRINIKIKDEVYEIGESFRKEERVGGFQLSMMKYFDFVVEELSDNIYELTGFIPNL